MAILSFKNIDFWTKFAFKNINFWQKSPLETLILGEIRLLKKLKLGKEIGDFQNSSIFKIHRFSRFLDFQNS